MDCVPRSCVRRQDALLDLRAVGTLLDAELEGMVCCGACRPVLRRYVAASWTLMQGSGRRSLLEKPSLVCPCGNKQWMNARGAEPIYTTATPMGRGSIYLRGESVSRTGSRSACVGGERGEAHKYRCARVAVGRDRDETRLEKDDRWRKSKRKSKKSYSKMNESAWYMVESN